MTPMFKDKGGGLQMLGIIGGTGLYALPGLENTSEKTLSTPYGDPSAPLLLGSFKGKQLVFLARHGRPHVLPPHKVNYRANLFAMKELGVNEIVAVNAVGGITSPMDSGVIAIPHQLIDYTWGREHTFWDGSAHQVDHIDFTEPYSDIVRKKLLRSASDAGIRVVDQAVYAATQGPRLETAAEIIRLGNDGCDVVGMTGMPEASLARELGIDYAGISLVVNKGAGLSDVPLTLQEMEKVMASGMKQVCEILKAYWEL